MSEARKEIRFAREILENLSTKKISNIPIRSNGKEFIEYKDDYIRVVGGVDTQALHVEIYPPLTEARSNPIIYVDDEGKCYRNHGERIHFIVYAEKLLGKIEVTNLYGSGVEKAAKIRSLIP